MAANKSCIIGNTFKPHCIYKKPAGWYATRPGGRLDREEEGQGSLPKQVFTQSTGLLTDPV